MHPFIKGGKEHLLWFIASFNFVPLISTSYLSFAQSCVHFGTINPLNPLPRKDPRSIDIILR